MTKWNAFLQGLNSPLRAAYGLYALVLVISLAYGFQYRFAGEHHATYFHVMTLPFVLIMILLSHWALKAWGQQDTLPELKLTAGLALMSFSFLMTTFFYSGELRPLPWIFPALLVIFTAAVCQAKWGSRASTLVFSGAAFCLYVFLISQVPHTQGANMLEIIEAASHEFLSGHNPYKTYEEIARLPFFYLPGLWLPYLPFVASGLDVRVFNLLALLALVLLFEKSLSLGTHKTDILSLTFYPILLSPPLVQMVLHGHVWPYWLFLCATLVMLRQHCYSWAALFLGITAATRQPSLFVMAPLAVYIYRIQGWQRLIGYAAVCIAAYLALVLPFSLWTGSGFWAQLYLTLSSLAADLFLVAPQISAASILQMLGINEVVRIAQFIILLAAVVFFLLRKEIDFPWTLFSLGMIYLWLIVFNPYVVRYLYFPGLLMTAIALSVHFERLYHRNTKQATLS